MYLDQQHTTHADLGGADRQDEATVRAIYRRFAITFLATYAVLLLVAGLDQLRTPFFHFDDAPALFAVADAYYHKAVSEGRWFNYLWHLRGFTFSTTANFQLYLVGWAAFLAASGTAFFRSGGIHLPVAFAVLAALGPQTTQISGWFNTLIPGIWLMAAFAVLTLRLSDHGGRWLMAIFIPISIQAYTPYPFFLLALCLLREGGPRRLTSIAWVTILFMGALLFGILAAQFMNYVIVGVFDIELQTWRDPTPARDLAGLIANLPKVWISLIDVYRESGFGAGWLSGVISLFFFGSLVVVARKAWHEALSVLLVIAAGLGALSAYSLLEGIEFPFRSTSFVWFAMAFTIVRAASLVGTGDTRGHLLAVAPVFALAALLVAPIMKDFREKSAWQDYAYAIINVLPPEADHIYIYGSFDAVPRSPVDASDADLAMHLFYVAGLHATDCEIVADACAEFGDPFDGGAPDETAQVRMVGSDALVMPARR